MLVLTNGSDILIGALTTKCCGKTLGPLHTRKDSLFYVASNSQGYSYQLLEIPACHLPGQ